MINGLIWVAPVRERGLKWLSGTLCRISLCGRSREGAWIEMALIVIFFNLLSGRSREGAWIEIGKGQRVSPYLGVAPVRERGLK